APESREAGSEEGAGARSDVVRPALSAERPLEAAPDAALVLRPSSGLRPKYPVVLAHGLFGFDTLEIAGKRHEYFRGISRELKGSGTDVYVVRVAPLAGVAARARQLADQVRRLPAKRVNIVAHSMGGLDARYAISHLGLSDVVASLTT